MELRRLAVAAIAAVLAVSGIGSILVMQNQPSVVEAIEVSDDDEFTPAVIGDDTDAGGDDATDDDSGAGAGGDDVTDDDSGAGAGGDDVTDDDSGAGAGGDDDDDEGGDDD